MSFALHSNLRLVLLARDVLQVKAWEIQEAKPCVPSKDEWDELCYHGDEKWAAYQDALDAIHDCIDICGGEID